jgi:hypothetical protein
VIFGKGGTGMCADLLLPGEDDGPGAVEAEVKVLLWMWLEHGDVFTDKAGDCL